MAIDRAATLKNAEKLLRQGKIEPAIAEYLRIVEDQPRDLNLANTLGDLYVRAGQIDKAVEQFTRIADSVSEEGFLPKASAIYKKILKLKPDHEHALLQAAEIAGSLGLYADARAYLTQIIERRRGRGDTRGAAQARIRLGSLDPSDFDGRMAAAAARVELNDVPGAVRDLKEIAAELVEKGRAADAIEALREAAVLTPDDDEIRQRLLDIYVAGGDFARARECASTPDQLKGLAAALEAGGHEDAALEVLGEAARLDPEDGELRARLARAFVARGDLQAAAEYLTVETAGDDPQLLFTVAEIRLRGETPEEGLAIVRRLLEQHPDRREEVALLGWTVGEQAPETGFAVVELAADAAVAGQDWASAAAALQEFVTRVPNHIPALMRLVEICVDGGLEATMYSAQAHLADAYHRRRTRSGGPLHRRGSGRARAVGPIEPGAFSPCAGVAGRARSRGIDRRAIERPVAVHDHRSLSRVARVFQSPHSRRRRLRIHPRRRCAPRAARVRDRSGARGARRSETAEERPGQAGVETARDAITSS